MKKLLLFIICFIFMGVVSTWAEQAYFPEGLSRPTSGLEYEPFSSARDRGINDRLELAVEYSFSTKGEQTFEVVDSQEDIISRLEYPHRGGMLTFKGEIGLLSGFSLGGRYGNSLFKKKTAIDQDWLPSILPDYVWLESESDCQPEVYFYDLNLYYHLVDLPSEEGEVSRALDQLALDRFSFDVFAGYQHQSGYYPSKDGITTIYWWSAAYDPISGEDSFYKVRYRGPRLGVRLRGSSGKFITSISAAYAWLKTDGYGWWNLRDYSFWMHGRRGNGIDVRCEVLYAFTPSFSIGLGFNFISCRQERLRESGIYYDGSYPNYTESDTIRNVDSKIFAPTFIFRFVW